MANPDTDLREVLYCSELAAGLPPTVVGAIVAQARASNAEREVSGLLVFDGHRFCQHLEGPRGVLATLMERIAADSRHDHVRVMHEGPLAARRYRSFELGLADSEDQLLGLYRLEGGEALARFLQLRQHFDVS